MTRKLLFKKLIDNLEGELFTDSLHRSIYATDASVYRKKPLAVAFPKNETDLQKLIYFASENTISLIPRAAGTSLAGQCVGDGIVVDTSKYLNKIISVDLKNETITVQPGVIRDDLNDYLKPYGLFFGPNTSSSNRCTIGGMVGNNSSGTTSIKYGVTRDKVISLTTLLSDASKVVFKPLSSEEFKKKTKGNSLENKIYKSIFDELSDHEVKKEIRKEFPKPNIHRRNTGYAIDFLLKSELFGGDEKYINLSKIICGSEGTLAFSTEITLKLDKLPPKQNVMLCVHFKSIRESLKAVYIAMKHSLYACELMDKIILDCTKNNREQQKNRFFLKEDPKAILILEIASDSKKQAKILAESLIADLKANNFGYHYPKIFGKKISKIHDLRKAGLGLLGNIIGDKKAVACIEDTAVELKDLPKYIEEFTKMMDSYNQRTVYYAHAGAGEIHLRPILNLKKKAGVTLFREITTKTAKLVKKYQGSFSGEHGDGIVRSEFIPLMIGSKNYNLLRRIKKNFDPKYIFNKGKIIDSFPMDKNLRYKSNRKEPEITTLLDFSDNKGILRIAEKCNGSGDCRKSISSKGTMCPSYRATKNEKDSTRARANALREFLTNSTHENKFDHKELYDVFDLCLSCKACARECPSNVDVAILKAEFLYQYSLKNGVSLRSKIFANNAKYNKLASFVPRFSNFILDSKFSKKIMGIAPKRRIPKLANTTLRKWYHKNKIYLHKGDKPLGKVYVFCDEFTNYYDLSVGIACLELLAKIGYKPIIIKHTESGRGSISKGLLSISKEKADTNIRAFSKVISKETPLVGIEPSSILTFRDEYLRLASEKEKAFEISKNTFTIEEFLAQTLKKGKLSSSLFTKSDKTIKIHGHCHQKSLSSMGPTFAILNIPENYKVSILNTGCCGMAGAFGYEKEHYMLSMKVGEDNLFAKIRNLANSAVIATSGTSCRHQIKDGLNKDSFHPVEILRGALI